MTGAAYAISRWNRKYLKSKCGVFRRTLQRRFHMHLGICTGKTMALTMLYQLLPYQTR